MTLRLEDTISIQIPSEDDQNDFIEWLEDHDFPLLRIIDYVTTRETSRQLHGVIDSCRAKGLTHFHRYWDVKHSSAAIFKLRWC